MPNLLGKTLFSSESVDGVIRLTHASESAANGEGGVRSQHRPGRWVNVAEIDLDRGFILSLLNYPKIQNEF